MTFPAKQERLCQLIDQRMRDRSVVARLAAELEDRQWNLVVWTGNMVISCRALQGKIDAPDRRFMLVGDDVLFDPDA